MIGTLPVWVNVVEVTFDNGESCTFIDGLVSATGEVLVFHSQSF